MLFYLGTHVPNWLGKTDAPLCVSRRVLHKRKTFPRAKGRWMLDSGAFSELSLNGGWELDPREYAKEIRRYNDEIGKLDVAVAQDWMCEPFMVERTGLSIEEHQARTVHAYLDLLNETELPIMPVLQGWTLDDYKWHMDGYYGKGIDLLEEPLVGVGSVCRRQNTAEVATILWALCSMNLHGFGVKIGGLRRSSRALVTADSMAWSYAARMDDPLPQCSHKNCANCLDYALQWRAKVMESIDAPEQTVLPL